MTLFDKRRFLAQMQLEKHARSRSPLTVSNKCIKFDKFLHNNIYRFFLLYIIFYLSENIQKRLKTTHINFIYKNQIQKVL